MPHLFDPITIKGITLRNRVGVPPMCMYSYENGLSNDWQVLHLGSRAAGGAGLIIAEATAVEPQGRITPHDAGIWSDEHIAPLARVSSAIKKGGAVPGIQIAHAGRKASTNRPWIERGKPIPPDQPGGWQTVGPSAIAYNNEYPVPKELSREEIHRIQAAFRDGARRALEAGFEWLEIHAAHGYLLHSFLSPTSNKRTDEYGGSFENRVRFLVETVRSIRPVWPDDLPLTIRISGTDWVEGGWTVDESVSLAKNLISEGIDLIDCSSGGGVAHAKVPLGPGYQVPISEAVRKIGMLTAAVGLITEPEQADEIIRNNQADIVLLGREILRNPHWPIHAALKLKRPTPIPSQYLRAF